MFVTVICISNTMDDYVGLFAMMRYDYSTHSSISSDTQQFIIFDDASVFDGVDPFIRLGSRVTTESYINLANDATLAIHKNGIIIIKQNVTPETVYTSNDPLIILIGKHMRNIQSLRNALFTHGYVHL